VRIGTRNYSGTLYFRDSALAVLIKLMNLRYASFSFEFLFTLRKSRNKK